MNVIQSLEKMQVLYTQHQHDVKICASLRHICFNHQTHLNIAYITVQTLSEIKYQT